MLANLLQDQFWSLRVSLSLDHTLNDGLALLEAEDEPAHLVFLQPELARVIHHLVLRDNRTNSVWNTQHEKRRAHLLLCLA